MLATSTSGTGGYHDGTTERSLLSDGVNVPASVRKWKLSRKLTPANLVILRDFFEQQGGGLIPFYFYNPFEIEPPALIGSNYDPTGDNTIGRHVCVFRGDWSETVGIARTAIPFEMAEVA
jgi:hypothetical protein